MEGHPIMPRGVQRAALKYGWASPWGLGLPRQGIGGKGQVCGPQQGLGGGHEGGYPSGGAAKHGPQEAPGMYQCEQPVTKGGASWKTPP